MSVTELSIAIVASIAGTLVFSLILFYLIVRCRRSRKKKAATEKYGVQDGDKYEATTVPPSRDQRLGPEYPQSRNLEASNFKSPLEFGYAVSTNGTTGVYNRPSTSDLSATPGKATFSLFPKTNPPPRKPINLARVVEEGERDVNLSQQERAARYAKRASNWPFAKRPESQGYI
jgi:hypothetical protein